MPNNVRGIVLKS